MYRVNHPVCHLPFVQVLQRAFLRKWDLKSVEPTFTAKELVSFTPTSFVTIHRMCRGDSMQSLAVRYCNAAIAQSVAAFFSVVFVDSILAHQTCVAERVLKPTAAPFWNHRAFCYAVRICVSHSGIAQLHLTSECTTTCCLRERYVRMRECMCLCVIPKCYVGSISSGSSQMACAACCRYGFCMHCAESLSHCCSPHVSL
jgi:hypothetical protein